MPGLILYGADSCRYTNRTRGQLDALGVEYQFVDLEGSPPAVSSSVRPVKRNLPVVEIERDGVRRRLVRPGDWELESELMRCGLIAKRGERPPSRSVIRGLRSMLEDR